MSADEYHVITLCVQLPADEYDVITLCVQLPADEYHVITTVSSTPSCFMYIFKNTTEEKLSRDVTEAQRLLADGESK